jgi:hypothetical protein
MNTKVQNTTSSHHDAKLPVLRYRLPKPTDNVQLFVSPFGKWEVDAVSDDGETLYLADNCGMIICHYTQVRLLER